MTTDQKPFRVLSLGAGVQSSTIAPPKHTRNQPCPCGSGRKFKRCCIGKAVEP
jgi:uncharacterized protein YecA (UPF0149 family)